MAKQKDIDAHDTVEQATESDNRANNYEFKDFMGAFFHYVKKDAVKREFAAFVDEAGRILKGESELEYGRDKRFSDPTWTNNAAYKRVGQSYLAFCKALENLVEEDKDDPMRYEKAKLVVDHITSITSPTNSLIGNPAALFRLFETGGFSLLKGTRNFLKDLTQNNGLPAQVDASGFTLGKDLGATEGAVIYRNAQLEILQYKPTTAEVYEIPLMVLAPQVNKFYFLDLAPGRSFVEYMTSQGYQVFIVSWKNPSPEQGDWRLDNYCEALCGAIDAVREVSGSESINTFGFCAGGITMSSLLSYLAQTGQADKVNSISYAVTLMDFSHPALIGILKSDFLLKQATGESSKKGVLAGDKLAAVFTMLRPKDLIWNYWENNYLMGNSAPAFDILAWNNDGTNLPAGLHEDFLRFFDENLLTKKGEFDVLGTPLDVGKIKQDAFVVATINDHLTPWAGCYQTTQLLGGKSEFVLSSAGHIAGLVNPPNNPKSWYMTGNKPGPDPEAWKEKAKKKTGSWWEYWVVWASKRSGEKKPAPEFLGSEAHPALADAPGTYVFEQVEKA